MTIRNWDGAILVTSHRGALACLPVERCVRLWMTWRRPTLLPWVWLLLPWVQLSLLATTTSASSVIRGGELEVSIDRARGSGNLHFAVEITPFGSGPSRAISARFTWVRSDGIGDVIAQTINISQQSVPVAASLYRLAPLLEVRMGYFTPAAPFRHLARSAHALGLVSHAACRCCRARRGVCLATTPISRAADLTLRPLPEPLHRARRPCDSTTCRWTR